MKGYTNVMRLTFRDYENAKKAEDSVNKEKFITELSQSEEYPYDYVLELVDRPKGYKSRTKKP